MIKTFIPTTCNENGGYFLDTETGRFGQILARKPQTGWTLRASDMRKLAVFLLDAADAGECRSADDC